MKVKTIWTMIGIIMMMGLILIFGNEHSPTVIVTYVIANVLGYFEGTCKKTP